MRKSYDITDIKHQSLGLALADFVICQHCHIVDRDSNRINVGHRCTNCGVPSPAGRFYFNPSVFSLIDLMQEFFHKDQSREVPAENGLFDDVSRKINSKIAVIIFFATLREVLLKNLLYDLMIAQNLPWNVCKQLFVLLLGSNLNNTHSGELSR